MPNRKHILLITSSYPASEKDPRAAAGVFVKDFAETLAERADVTVLTQQAGDSPLTARESDVQVIRFLWAGKGRPLSTLRIPRDIALISSVMFQGCCASFKLAQTFRPDCILACWAIPSGLWALCLKWLYGIPYSVWCLGSDIWDYGKNPFTKRLLRVILREASHLYADGYQLAEDVRFVSGNPCAFLPSARRLPNPTAIKADIRQNRRNYLFIGRYHPNKGPDILLEAVAKLKPEIREKVHFHFFGGGPLREKLESLIAERDISDIVTLKGYIDAQGAADYLKACDALIIPSRIESVPVVLSDALQSKTPLIASDVGDMGFLLRKYRAGIAVPPESPDQLAEVITHHILHGDNFDSGRKELLEIFDLSKSVDKFVSDIL